MGIKSSKASPNIVSPPFKQRIIIPHPSQYKSFSLSLTVPLSAAASTLQFFISLPNMSIILLSSVLILLLPFLFLSVSADEHIKTCRSYCGNITVDYPFAVQSGCGHPGYRDLLFCVNDVLMFHISSGSYRVLKIDYAYHTLTLHDPYMSNCDSLLRDGKGNGFVLESWRNPYLSPAPDNIFMLIGCNSQSPLFQGFPGKHLPCRNVSSMSCEEYLECPAWSSSSRSVSKVYGSSPPACCSVSFEAIRAINLTKLGCEGYSSAYSVAPLRVAGANEWLYGIRVKYSVPGDFAFCQACEATGGTCGHDDAAVHDLCLCDGWNSTSNCDSVVSMGRRMLSSPNAITGIFASISVLYMDSHPVKLLYGF